MLFLSSPVTFTVLPAIAVPSSSFSRLQPSSLGRYHHLHTRKRTIILPLATSSPPPFSSPPPEQLYQPFHPPPTPLPSQFSSIESTDELLRTLRDRLGLWFEYAPLISALARDGLHPPSSIEEATGITGVEQNRLVVAAQVRLSVVSSGLSPELVPFFDSSIGGPDILYELRLLSNRQRVDAARFVIDGNLDAKAARELARAIKEFPRRRSDLGWDAFSPSSSGDCLAFMYLRQSRENRGSAERALELAAEVAETAKAKDRIMEEMKGGTGGEAEDEDKQVLVPVVRMKAGEAVEATKVVVLPVCRATLEETTAAPECGSDKTFGIVTATAGWRRWVVLPGWEPVATAVGDGGLVVVEFKDGKVLPWKATKTIKEESVLVVVDRRKKGVDGGTNLYIVNGEDGGLVVERGSGLAEKGVVRSLGRVVLVVRPPKLDTEDLYLEDDWD